MADAQQDRQESIDVPQALAAPSGRGRAQLVWLVPIIAALVGAWLAIDAVLERGPVITISFGTAEGLEPGKTKVKYKHVDIGEVKEVVFAEDGSRVVATVELAKQAEKFLAEDTRFWVVRPRVSGAQVSGLTTLLSGSYIGIEVGKSQKRSHKFTGLEVPPIVTVDLPGRHFELQADHLGSLEIGSPVYLRRMRVGQVVAFELDKDGREVSLRVFVNSPYDRHVNANTRFWHASGISLSLDATGVRVDTESLVALLLGGIAFETPENSAGAQPAQENAAFKLYADREHALKLPDAAEQTYALEFRESVRGLSRGAPVDFRGIVIGEVISIDVEHDPAGPEIRVPVGIRLYPARLSARYRKDGPAAPAADARLLDRLVERGLRAQLRTASLVTGQLYVALDDFPRAPRARIDRSRTPPRIPTVPGQLQELQDAFAQVARRLDRLPLEEIGADVRNAIGAFNGTLASVEQRLQGLDAALKAAERLALRLDAELAPEARAVLADARRTMAAVRQALSASERVLSSSERVLSPDSPLQYELRDALREIARAAEALRALAEYLDRHPESLLQGRRAEKP